MHSARLALGLSYVDALDPSPKAVRKALAKGRDEGYYGAYQSEKELPEWLRSGGAVYAERFFRDDTVAEGGDPWWARKWSLDNLRSRGGLGRIEDIFVLSLDADDRDGAIRLLLEMGLLVSFMVDGGCAAVEEQHRVFKQALLVGRLRASHLKDLQAALIAHQTELREFAGF